MEHNGIVPPRARLRDAEGERMTRVNDYPLLIEFVPGTRISREPKVVSKLPIVQNGPPGTSIVFGDGATVPLPTDQIIFAEDGGGAARVGFGGMSFEGMRPASWSSSGFATSSPWSYCPPSVVEG